MTDTSTDALRKLQGEITPGPWVVEFEAEPDGEQPEVYVCSPATVCDYTVVAAMGRATSIPPERRDADARSIALLPDLLSEVLRLREQNEALAAALEVLTGKDEDGPFHYLRHKPLCAFIGGYGYCDCGFEVVVRKAGEALDECPRNSRRRS